MYVLLQNIENSYKTRMASGGRNLFDDMVEKMMMMWEFGDKEECKKLLELALESIMEAWPEWSREEALAMMPKYLDNIKTARTKMVEAGGCTKECPGCGSQGIKR